MYHNLEDYSDMLPYDMVLGERPLVWEPDTGLSVEKWLRAIER